MRNKREICRGIQTKRERRKTKVISPAQVNVSVDLVSNILSNLKDPRRGVLFDFHHRWRTILEQAKGSINSSFSWSGGYLAHIKDTFEIAQRLYPVVSVSSNINLEEALITLYFHDFERPVRYARTQRLLMPDDIESTELGISSAGRQSFYSEVLRDLGIVLNERELYALRYFQKPDRAAAVKLFQGEALAGFCQMCDVSSHRKGESYLESRQILNC
jgi:hypothetical protein